jgi:hypothetical protein
MDGQLTAIYCLCDDVLKALQHRPATPDDRRRGDDHVWPLCTPEVSKGAGTSSGLARCSRPLVISHRW